MRASAPGTISDAPKQPLAFNENLQSAADDQSAWLLANTTLSTFSHSGPGGDMPDDRAKDAGYALPTTDYTRENAGINLYSVLGDLTTLVAGEEQAYFVDTANSDGGRGHRLQMMDPNLKEVGSAVATGPYNYTDPTSHITTTYQGFETVIDMGFHDDVPYLTGVAYDDDIVQDNFYTPGEGLAGVSVVAVRTSDGKTFATQTQDAGQYTMALDPGTYNIYGFGGPLGGFVTYGNVTVTDQNVEEDFTPAMVTTSTPPFALLSAGTLFVNGTAGNDTIGISRSGDIYTVTRTGSSPQTPMTFSVSDVSSIQVDLGDGDDAFSVGKGVPAVYVNGGLGNDTISGGEGNDTLTGAAGNDSIAGNGGDDRLNGGTRNDTLSGGDGDDRLYGDDGNDKLYGGNGVDRLFGEAGNDYLSGGSSNDKEYGGDGNDSIIGDNQNDLLSGDDGNDTIAGANGNDTIIGGAGNDSLMGNAGNDSIDALDGAIDTIDGGAGHNTGTLDADDVSTNMS